MEDKVYKARKILDEITSSWFIGQKTADPMLLAVWISVEKIDSKNIDAIGINSRTERPFLLYNPNFVLSVQKDELEMILVSEMFKLILKHATTRRQNPQDINAISSQITIDEMFQKEFSDIVNFGSKMPTAKDFNLPEKDFKERYFNLLNDKQEQLEHKLNQKYGDPLKKDDQKPSGKAEQKSKQPPTGKGEEDPTESSEGSGEGQEGSEGEDGQESGEGGKEFGNSKDALDNYFDPRNNNSDGWGEESNDNYNSEMKETISRMKNVGTNWGRFTGNAMEEILAAHEPKVSVKQILRHFNTTITTEQTVLTRMKPNRRFDLDAYGKKKVNITKILFAGDTSGSMSNDDLAEGFAVVNSACRLSKVDYLLWDTEIKYVEKNFSKVRKNFKVNGRGGTDVQAVLDFAEKGNYDGIIIFSDMEFSPDVRKPKKGKVLWLGSHKSAPNTVPWGIHAKLDR